MKIKKNLLIVILLIVSVIPLGDLFQSGLPITHDGQDHVARIANFYQNLQEGVIVPRWAGNLNWGYGHPILMFLYPLPSYLASFFHFLGLSFVDSTKAVFITTYILSGLTMYMWVREFLNKYSALIAATLYMIAPYRFVDIYVRGAIGEHVAFVFLPLILYFILKLSAGRKHNFVILGSFSFAGLILSHNAISIMFMPLVFLYTIYLFFNSKTRKFFVLSSTVLLVLGFLLSSFFWIPAFFEGKYTLRDIVASGEYSSRFTTFRNFLYSSWNYGISGEFSLQVGIAQWIVILSSVLTSTYLYKNKKLLGVLSFSILILFFFTLFLMTGQSKPIWETIRVLQKFQFPWRFLSISVFLASILGGIQIWLVPSKYKRYVVVLLVLIILFLNKDYWHVKEYMYKPESFFTSVYYGTTDTGESAPIWSVRFMEKESSTHLEAVEGSAKITEIKRSSIFHSYLVDVDERVRMRENTLYFPGWKVYVDKREVSVQFQDPRHRGLMTFFVEKGKHPVVIEFQDTKVRRFANMISLVSFFGMAIIYIFFYLKKRIT